MSVPPPLPAFNPYAAPEARVEEAPPAELEFADRGIRLVAVIVDGFVLMVPIALIGIVAAIVAPQQSGGEPSPVFLGVFGVLVAAVVIAVLVVNLLWLHRYGQTIAKRMFKIRVLRSDGSHCALSRIILARWLPVWLLSLLPLIGYVVSLVDALMIFRDDRKCLHDVFADTIVVKA